MKPVYPIRDGQSLKSKLSNNPYHRNNLPTVMLCYALKANSDKHVVDLVVKNGCGFDVASKNEIKMVIQGGVDRSKIVYANPTRPIEHLKYAQQQQARDKRIKNIQLFYYKIDSK